MSGTEALESSNEGRRGHQSVGREPTPASIVIAATGGSDVVDVGRINYVARRAGFNAEECIQRAVNEGHIEAYDFDLDGDREYDAYRLTAKGRRAADRHMSDVFKQGAIDAKRIQEEYEERRRSGRDGFAWPNAEAPAQN